MSLDTQIAQIVADAVRAELAPIRALLEQATENTKPLTIPQFAELVGCSESTVRRAIDQDLIRSVHLGGRTTVIPAAELAGRFASERRRLRVARGGTAAA